MTPTAPLSPALSQQLSLTSAQPRPSLAHVHIVHWQHQPFGLVCQLLPKQTFLHWIFCQHLNIYVGDCSCWKWAVWFFWWKIAFVWSYSRAELLVPGQSGSRGQHSLASSLCYSRCGCLSRGSPCQAPHCGPPRTGSPAEYVGIDNWVVGLITCLNTLEIITKEVSTTLRGLDTVTGGDKVDLGVWLTRQGVGRIVDSKHVACMGCWIVGEADVAKTIFWRFKGKFMDAANINE